MIILFLILSLLCSPVYAGMTINPETGGLDVTPDITDGSTTVYAPSEITYSGATVSDDGDGTGTVTMGAGSGGGWTDDGSTVRLSTSGDNVGVGTTTANNKLTIVGSLDVDTNIGIGTTAPRAALEVGSGGTLDSVGANDVYIQNDLEVDNMIYGNVTGAVTGNASTASALAANGGNCNAGEYALGVDASGAVESCTDATTEINAEIANVLDGTDTFTALTVTGSATVSTNVGIGTTVPLAALEVGSGGSLDNVGANDVYIQNDLEVDGVIYHGTGILRKTKPIAVFNITNGDTAISAAVTDPVACTLIRNNSVITAWYLDCDQSGSIVLDVWKNTWDDTPEANGDSIAGTEKPTLSTDVSASDTDLQSMTTDWNAGQNVCIEIESAATVTKCRLVFDGYND